ncbi:DUF2304 domain-containing protein [Microbacterium sp. NPDC058342]|uniref:DUF2304 domain-containing protein n=1 Tax=Microbacterium sp. NPDC058342 TaxID=3346454 RepID=UPI0036473AA2
MWIQFLLIAAIIAIGAFFMRRTGADNHLAIRRIVFGLFVVVAILAVVFPQTITWFAQLIGVGRGTDLLLYIVSMMFLVFVYTQFHRNAQLQQKITGLARAVALLEAERAKPEPTAPADRDGISPLDEA